MVHKSVKCSEANITLAKKTHGAKPLERLIGEDNCTEKKELCM